MIFAALAASASATAQQPAAGTGRLYGVRENVEHVDISPDGNRVVFLQPGPGRTTVVFVHDLGGTSAPRQVIYSSGDPERLRTCSFVTNDRLICQMSGMTVNGNFLIPFSRLFSIDIDGQNVTQLGQRESFFDARIRQFDGEVLDWTGGEPGTILMARDYVPEAGRIGTRMVRTDNGLAVDRIDVRTLRSSRVEAANRRAGGYLSDGRGRVRMMASPVMVGGTGQFSGRTDYYYRTAASNEWQPFGSFETATGEGMQPLAVDAALDVAYVLRKLDGRFALYRVKLDGSMATELAYANDQVDVSGIVQASHGARVVGATFADDRQRVVYFDPAYASLARSLARAMPNLPMIDFESASADGNRIIVHAGSDTDAGRYFVYDRTTRGLNEILIARPDLENAPAATMRAISYPAADGTQIPGYLTLPAGSDGRNLPAVVLPHGGPEARDVWGYDWLAQYLARQGYAVLQPNFRGSAGYGDRWMQQNGFRGWRTSIGDITAGARWLAAQGTANPARIAILGWSYGGYAALQAGATEPDLFRAIVAIAPVTDLQQAKDDFRGYQSRRVNAAFIGDGPHVVEGSPARHAAAFRAPVLLFHGDRDLNVPVIHSRRMDDALRDAGKRSELVLFPGLEHDLADTEARARMLDRIGAFLAAELR